jgi:pimeloyl-ACP methyl ester carboxylesterase
MRRLTAAAITVGVAMTGVASVPVAQGAQQRPTKPAVRAYNPPPLKWGTCADKDLAAFAECSMLTVPLDYAHPGGRKIKLAVSRVPHRSSASHYQGVMLTNPGGPGGSGLYLSVLGTGDIVPGTADDDYDWIGFDPRGVGSSVPALTCNDSFFKLNRPSYVPTTDRIESYWLRKSKKYAADCKKNDKIGLLDHVTTRDSVADMESLRKALGRRQINFYGFSYGTYLGQVYATKHPSRVRRFVLDSNVDPRRVWYAANLDQDKAFQKTFEAYFGYLAQHDDVFHLGTNADAIDRRFYRELAKLDAHPVDGVGPDELIDVMTSAGYYVYDWVEIGKAYAALYNDGDASGIKDMYVGANPQNTPGSDNGYVMYLATQCTDTQWPQDYDKVRLDNWRTFAQAPIFTWSNAWFNGPCNFWKGKVGPAPVYTTGRHVTSKILLIDETLDAATPFSGSLEVRRRFPTASLIEGVGGTTHAGSLSGVPCTDNAIAKYLADGTVPARKAGNVSDKKCPPVPAPDPNARIAQRKVAGTSAAAIVREALQRAQLH